MITIIKKILYGVISISSMVSFAQVGINTENPRATLQIDVKNTTSPDSSTGILIPRVSSNPAQGNENGLERRNRRGYYF